jgi:hypothetical protein
MGEVNLPFVWNRTGFVFGGPSGSGKTWTAIKFAQSRGMSASSNAREVYTVGGAQYVLTLKMTRYYIGLYTDERSIVVAPFEIHETVHPFLMGPHDEDRRDDMWPRECRLRAGLTAMVWFGPDVPPPDRDAPLHWEPAAQWCARMGLPPPLEPLP